MIQVLKLADKDSNAKIYIQELKTNMVIMNKQMRDLSRETKTI